MQLAWRGGPSPFCRADGGAPRLAVAQLELVARIGERARSLGRICAPVVFAGDRPAVLRELKAAVDSGGGYCCLRSTENMEVVSAAVSLPEHGAVAALETLVPPIVARCSHTPGFFLLAAEFFF